MCIKKVFVNVPLLFLLLDNILQFLERYLDIQKCHESKPITRDVYMVLKLSFS